MKQRWRRRTTKSDEQRKSSYDDVEHSQYTIAFALPAYQYNSSTPHQCTFQMIVAAVIHLRLMLAYPHSNYAAASACLVEMSDMYFTFISIFPAHKSQNYDLVMRSRCSLRWLVCFTILLCDCFFVSPPLSLFLYFGLFVCKDVDWYIQSVNTLFVQFSSVQFILLRLLV